MEVVMAKGILYVESFPKSREAESDYHDWYERHVRELVAIDGIRSARRFAPVGGEGPFVAVYEIETDGDLAVMWDRMAKALERGEVTRSPALQLNPPPVSRLYTEISEYAP
jgi:hypothetical protein